MIFSLLFVAVAVSCSAALSGLFLVVRRVSLISDAVSHAVLCGIAVLFLVTKELHSGILLGGAVLSGIAAVMAIEFLSERHIIKSDAAIGIVFPLFFSVGVILISRFVHAVHIDTDMVMLGELAFVPLTRCVIAGRDCGPLAAWISGGLCVVQAFLLWIFYKQFLVVSWDPLYAKTLGIRVKAYHYVMVVCAALTAITSFESVGSIVVVALVITPAATALLCAHTMESYIITTLLCAVISAVVGTVGGWVFNISFAGAIALVAGCVFFVVWLRSLRRC